MALICDTGPLYAALDRHDAAHASCVALLESTQEPVLVPAPVLVELDWLATAHLGPEPFLEFLRDVDDGLVQVVDLVRADYRRARELVSEYSDLRLGFVDAAVLSVVERLRESKVATLDRRDFAVVRPRHVEALELLPV